MDKTADLSFVSWLLDHGADPNAACQLDATALSTAVYEGPVEVIKLLLQQSQPPFRGQLLHHATQRSGDDVDRVLQMVVSACHPDIDQVMYSDHPLSYELYKVTGLGTALHTAAQTGTATAARMLVSLGADVSVKGTRGRTALEVAELAGNAGVVQVLKRSSHL